MHTAMYATGCQLSRRRGTMPCHTDTSARSGTHREAIRKAVSMCTGHTEYQAQRAVDPDCARP
eukprot:scaffold45075_cov63-Phaeocystis_antarctica.AAC.1